MVLKDSRAQTYLDAIFGVLADADGGFIFGRAQQVQNILIVDLELQMQRIDRWSAKHHVKGALCLQ